MDVLTTGALVEISVALSKLVAQNAVTAVNAKIKAIKDEKNADKIRNTYDEIINELISQREEAVRIAQIYRAEIERIVISDEDIEHLQETISNVLDVMKKSSMEAPAEAVEPLKDLITVDTLKTMQLLGFNYKAAIGEPLTQICADKIISIGGKNKKNKNK